MTKELLISSSAHETKVAVLEDDQVVEVYFQRESEAGLVGGIYKGRVNRVLPGMQSAFVDIGLERDAFLYVSDFFEESEEYDRVFTDGESRSERAGRPEPQLKVAASGEDFAPPKAGEEVAVPQTASPESAEPTAAAPAEEAAPPSPEGEGPQADAATAQTAKEAASTAPSEEVRPREFGRRDFRGRRHRRRPGFREGRSPGRREPRSPSSESREEGPSHPLEPLPGESLARYGGAAEPAPASASESEGTEVEPFAPTAAENPEGLEPGAGSPPPVETTPDASTWAASQSISDVEEEIDSFRATSSEEEKRAHAAEAAATASVAEEEKQSRGSASPAEVSGSGSAGETVAQQEGPDLDQEGDPSVPSESEEETESKDLLAGQPSVLEPAPETADSESQRQSTYSVREYEQRPHLGPRRGRRGGRGRFRGHHGRRSENPAAAGNHQPMAISELLKEGQEILVQIAKEPLGTKGARITSHIALPGRYLVYMPTITHIGVSRKIPSEEERLRLRNIILDHRGSLTGGFIVRTAGAGRSEEDLKADLAFLTNLWNEIRSRAERSKAPALLHRDLTLIERILRDLLSPDFKRIRVDNELEYEHVLEFVNRFQPALIGNVKLYTRDAPMFEEFGVQAEIDKALKPKVWLKSGGYIVINQTEALVAIDVNTGKFTGKTNRLEDTIVRTNIDAVIEIVRQIRLRDLGGIIVIDFIDMDERRNRAKVVQALEDALRRDRAPAKILSFNEFGLVALTRKRAKQSLERTLCEPCPYCAGAGWVKSVVTVGHEILAEARKMAAQIDGRVMTLRVSPQVATTLKAKGGALVSEIEAASGKELLIKSDASIPQERFEIF